MNYALGGAFSSRINLSLERDKAGPMEHVLLWLCDLGRYAASALQARPAGAECLFMKEITNYKMMGLQMR
jgi:hypothetical protein